jgi:hypothetical protein
MAVQEFTPTSDSPREADDSAGIKGALAAALAEHDKAAAESEPGEENTDDTRKVEPKPEETEKKTPPAEGEKVPVEAKKEAKPEKTEAVPAGEKKPTEETAKASEPPAHWSAEHKKMFGALPTEAKAFLLDRVKSTEADYTRKTQALAEKGKEFDGLEQIFGPQRDKIKAAGLTVPQVVQGWANAELALQNGRGLELIPGIAKAYKIDPIKLASEILRVGGVTDPKALEQAAAAAAETAKNTPAPVVLPPEVIAKLERADKVASFVETQQRTTAEAEVARINGELEKFKTATDAQGALLHPYYGELEETMARLVDQAIAAKQPIPPIDQLYEEAIFANPAVRTKYLETREAAAKAQADAAQQAARDKAAVEAKAKSEKARKAGSSVTGSSGTGQPLNGRTGGNQSLRATIAAAADESDAVVH